MGRLVISSLSRFTPSSWDMSPCRSFMDDNFGSAFEKICRRCFFLQDLRRRSIPQQGVCNIFKHSNLAYLIFYIILHLLASLRSGLDSKTSSLHDLIIIAINELQHMEWLTRTCPITIMTQTTSQSILSSLGPTRFWLWYLARSCTKSLLEQDLESYDLHQLTICITSKVVSHIHILPSSMQHDSFQLDQHWHLTRHLHIWL
jgi:hypothetical protein